MNNKVLLGDASLRSIRDRQRKSVNNLLDTKNVLVIWKLSHVNLKKGAASAAKARVPLKHPVFGMPSVGKEWDKHAIVFIVRDIQKYYIILRILGHAQVWQLTMAQAKPWLLGNFGTDGKKAQHGMYCTIWAWNLSNPILPRNDCWRQ